MNNPSLETSFAGLMEIVKTPAGEAPPWVRDCWIGIRLNYYFFSEPSEELGVLSDSEQPQRTTLNVMQKHALETLSLRHPKAAEWWANAGFPNEHPFFSIGIDECDIITKEALYRELSEEMMGARDR